MEKSRSSGKALKLIVTITALITAAFFVVSIYFSSSSIHSLLTENTQLKSSIKNLTDERQIGFATVQSQEKEADGSLRTTIRFVQTDAKNPKQIVSEQLFTIEGDVAFFDTLIVKFTDDYVKDGKERALYLWRRIYSETTAAEKGQLIEQPSTAPERYYAITRSLKIKNRDVFWSAVWDLANQPDALSEYGIQAVFGNAIYTKLEPGNVYTFKISPTGQIYPEITKYF